MATTFEFVVAVEKRRAAAARDVLRVAHADVARLEDELSEYRAGSPVHRLNAAPPGLPVPFTADGIALLRRALELARRTEHAFDPTAKSEDCPLPPGERLAVDFRHGTVARRHPRVRLGFGAIGKGFALDRVRARLEAEGLTDYLLSAGGSSVVLSGYAGPRGEPWRWGWSWKRDASGESLGLPLAHANGAAVALGVSGLHEQGEHLRRARDGAPLAAADALRSALVADRSAADADALSTALFVAGWERGRELLGRLPASTPGAAVIERDETPRWNGVCESLFRLSSSLAPPAALAALVLPAALTAPARAQEKVDLDELGGNDAFTPYVVEREHVWIALPALMIAFVLLHLKKYRATARKKADNPFHKF